MLGYEANLHEGKKTSHVQHIDASHPTRLVQSTNVKRVCFPCALLRV